MDDLEQMTPKHMDGSLVYLQSDQTLLIRIRDGWQYLAMGEKLRFEDDSSTLSSTSQPFGSSSINNNNGFLSSNMDSANSVVNAGNDELRGNFFEKKNHFNSELIDGTVAAAEKGESLNSNDINANDVLRVSFLVLKSSNRISFDY